MHKIFSLGTSNRSLEEWLDLVEHYRIQCVVDVRRFPTSSRFPHFKRENLATVLTSRDIDYLWMGDSLGGFRKGGYQQYMKTEDYQKGIEKLIQIAIQKRTAFICRERFPWKCHRRFIAQSLEKNGWTVHHIIDIDRLWTPTSRLDRPLFPPENA